MTGPVNRKFTVLDGMMLVAAAAIALAWEKARLDPGLRLAIAGATSWFDRLVLLPYAVEPFVAMAVLAIFSLRLQRPRPRLARLACQPGFVACATALMAMALPRLVTASALPVNLAIQGRELYSAAFEWERLNRAIHSNFQLPGFAVLAAWLTLWAGGLWRPERSWVDRAGRVLGAYLIVMILAHLWYLRYLSAFISAHDLD